MWNGCGSIPVCTHAMGGTKVQLQTELKGLMDHTAYLILKRCGPLEDPCRIIQLSAAVPSLSPWLRPAEERQTDREEEEEESCRICGLHCCHRNHV